MQEILKTIQKEINKLPSHEARRFQQQLNEIKVEEFELEIFWNKLNKWTNKNN